MARSGNQARVTETVGSNRSLVYGAILREHNQRRELSADQRKTQGVANAIWRLLRVGERWRHRASRCRVTIAAVDGANVEYRFAPTKRNPQGWAKVEKWVFVRNYAPCNLVASGE